MSDNRRNDSYRVRAEAAELARQRDHPAHRSNGDEQRWADAAFAMCFTKGLEHDPKTGLAVRPSDVLAIREAIDRGEIDRFSTSIRVPSVGDRDRRQWEAPTAGVVFDLQGPDAQAVTMPPAPALGTPELAYEMAEVYELALLRDQPLTDFRSAGQNAALADSLVRLNALHGAGDRYRATTPDGNLDAQTAFRGSSPGVDVGPYVSQFLLMGSAPHDDPDAALQGFIDYGPLRIDQRVRVTPHGKDWMTALDDWLLVQNGANVRDNSTLFQGNQRRFITSPRDLATYVHDDALYQAYLNACLLLLDMGTPTDPAFDRLSGRGRRWMPDGPEVAPYRRTAGGFALFGGPHILTLVCEVATRALKAVRFQKFNNHLRLRPEALAARIECATEIAKVYPDAGAAFSKLRRDVGATVDAVEQANGSALLPMAFQEGSPMHPSYGAGHAAVAGACVTVLKAYFDTSARLLRGCRIRNGEQVEVLGFHTAELEDGAAGPRSDTAVAFVPNADGSTLECETGDPFLTLEHELNKLAANISIGRNMAGVHYYSDYYDSLRLGEEVAIGMLEEQALCYPTDDFVLTVPTFDGEVRRIGA